MMYKLTEANVKDLIEWLRGGHIKRVLLALENLMPVKPSPYDQTALALCTVCGWKTLIPGDCCLNCERDKAIAQPVPPAALQDVTEDDVDAAIETFHGQGMRDALEEFLKRKATTAQPAPAVIKAAQPVEPTTRRERARRLYEQHPTYEGAKPIPWASTTNEVKREWLDKEKLTQTAPAAPYQVTNADVHTALYIFKAETSVCNVKDMREALEAHEARKATA